PRLVLQLADHTPDLRRAWQEAQDLAVSRAEHIDRGVGDRPAWLVRDVDSVRAARDVDHGTAVEKRRHRLRLEGGGHDDDAQVVAGAPGLARQGDGEIGVDA